MAPEYEGRCLTIFISDGGAAASWKRAPYYAVLKQIAIFQLRNGHVLMAVDGDRRTLILPDSDIEIGQRSDYFTWTVRQSGPDHEPHLMWRRSRRMRQRAQPDRLGNAGFQPVDIFAGIGHPANMADLVRGEAPHLAAALVAQRLQNDKSSDSSDFDSSDKPARKNHRNGHCRTYPACLFRSA